MTEKKDDESKLYFSNIPAPIKRVTILYVFGISISIYCLDVLVSVMYTLYNQQNLKQKHILLPKLTLILNSVARKI